MALSQIIILDSDLINTLDMLIPLSQQRMEALNISYEIRAVSLKISRAFDTVWHPVLLSKLSAYGIQSQLHSWITDFLHSHSQRVALNRTLSSPLPIKVGVPQGSDRGPILLKIFINDLTDSLGKSSLSLC